MKSVTEFLQRPTMHLYEDFKIRQIHYPVHFDNSRSRREVEAKIKFDYHCPHIHCQCCQATKLTHVVAGYHGYKLYSLE